MEALLESTTPTEILPDLLLLSTRLVREEAANYAGPRTVSEPAEVEALVNELYDLHDQTEEHFIAIGLNTKNHVTAVWEVSVGSMNASIVHPRELYRPAVMHGCASIIVVHNHPSGDPNPSGADLQLTNRLARAGDVMGIPLLDHIIVGDTTLSFRREGIF